MKLANYTIAIANIAAMGVILYVLGGGLKGTENDTLRAIFLSPIDGFPETWVWYWSALFFGIEISLWDFWNSRHFHQ